MRLLIALVALFACSQASAVVLGRLANVESQPDLSAEGMLDFGDNGYMGITLQGNYKLTPDFIASGRFVLADNQKCRGVAHGLRQSGKRPQRAIEAFREVLELDGDFDYRSMLRRRAQIELDRLENVVRDVLRQAERKGSTQAEVSAHTSQGLAVTVRMGEVDVHHEVVVFVRDL